MDPNATLDKIKELLPQLREDADFRDGFSFQDVCLFVEAVDNLNDWLSKGGFLPKDWQR